MKPETSATSITDNSWNPSHALSNGDAIAVKFFDFEPDAPLNQLSKAFDKVIAAISGGVTVKLIFKSPRGKLIEYDSVASEELAVRKFTAVMVVLTTILSNLKEGKVTTKRDLYYQHVSLFKHNQKFTDNLLDLILCNLDVELQVLNLCPNQKGLMYYGDHSTPVLIPISFNEVPKARFNSVIVIEKEAVFRSFVNHVSRFKLLQDTIVVTGLGFPDALTRSFVKWLDIPVLAFMDSDIYGILIYNCYKKWTGRKFDRPIKFESTQWKNDTSSEMTQSCEPCGSHYILLGCFLLEYRSGYMNIAKRDIKVMINAITTVDEPTVKREIQRGLFLYKKAEMNAVNRNQRDVIDYIIAKVTVKLSQFQY